MGSGLLVMLFGLILKYILDRVLSRPIQAMVDSANKISHGNTALRFNERRTDEFGFLAKFINQALDSVVSQNVQLEASRIALSEEKERAEVTLRSIADGVITTDVNGRIQFMNPIAEHLSGWSAADAMGRKLEDVINLVHESTGMHLESPVSKTLKSNRTERISGHGALIRHTGESVSVEAIAAPMHNDRNAVIGAVMVLQDVSENRVLTKQLSYQASHDALTGQYNRPKFEERLAEALESLTRSDRHHVLCYLDLDQFKIVNDTSGHRAGDELLRQLSLELKKTLREDDVLARLGGDEFGILLLDCPMEQARHMAERIRELVRSFSFVWENKTFNVGVSIGVVAIDHAAGDAAELMSAADLACYTAKDMGRNRIHVYEPSDVELAQRHGEMHWAANIMQAIQENRLMLYRQPMQSLSDAACHSDHWEILLRMQDQQGRMIKPDDFISAVERYHLMSHVDRWVIRAAFESLADEDVWLPVPGKMRRVAINLSGTSLSDEGLAKYIQEQSLELGVRLDEICFEITETVAISNLAQATRFINEMRQMGSHFALDDFGSGLSSFTYLKTLPVDYLKIDGSFVVDMMNDSIDHAMVESIAHMGHIMDVMVVAEWVEDEATLARLRDIGVDYAQGYHVGKPQLIQSLMPQALVG
jgi:diguanylate cyclase (GGDEF)-like protein/PAS domain S-box-containing protein